MDHRQWQIDIAHEWRERHHLPRLSDDDAQQLYWGADAVPAPRKRMNTQSHINRLLRVWDLWKPQQPK